MKKLIYTTLLFAMISGLAFSQQLTQTLRGTIIDIDSKLPLIGATVKIAGSDPLIGTTTDLNGEFKLEKIGVGRISLQLSY
ncbi:MAG: carboxypeptidase-like regulatory domain-containing protein, partial [Paludibacter sp.]